MLKALFNAINDITSPELRGMLWKSIALSIVLFAALWFGIEFALSFVTLIPWPWLLTTLQVATGLGLFAAFFFLMAPVTALFAGLFQDSINEKVEKRHYPSDRPGKPLTAITGFFLALKFAALALGINIVVLPLVFFGGFGAALILAANSYLISREYFEMAAARYMPLEQARTLRRDNALRVWIAGIIPGALAMVPFLNFVTPVFATSYFLHFFKGGK
ncbi:EI24 domain-containing protein [Aestuariivirga litoralis]|uniref:EI24 domain-containing protein n=1 Tax=Aestuariivirga litoralis TaxID=2650924 RepID=UPI0018C643DB|nr:EI24 domain-containing protein [Aestuariivirga litoralis]MBG1232013.1 cysteine biosynthesis protein CysZ [Aestuariivirga litoralis]